ncbi:MAG: Fic family protein [Coriobacteriia bacterium]|nr:Fic family protein [Coriobacteriia bacterium]
MKYLSTKDIAKKWNLSERSVRNYCQAGRIDGAKFDGRSWLIPEDATRPSRKVNLLQRLRQEKDNKIKGGIYHKIMIDFTFNSNHMEGSKLTHEQTRYIYETNTIGVKNKSVNVDDVIETINHFKCVDYIIDRANYKLSENYIKRIHAILKDNTSDSRKDWFAVGDYKNLSNEVGGKCTTKPEDVQSKIYSLIQRYNKKTKHNLRDILQFHYEFERIHPFQDGNGRVGRLIMFKECLRNSITPLIIEDDIKEFYYRGLNEWKYEPGYLTDTCLTAQDRFNESLKYFNLT